MVFGEFKCPKCNKKYDAAQYNNIDDTYTCRNCGISIIFHMEGENTTFDCPICGKEHLVTDFVPIDINRSLDFSDKKNSQYVHII